jgi:hypothetical protein
VIVAKNRSTDRVTWSCHPDNEVTSRTCRAWAISRRVKLHFAGGLQAKKTLEARHLSSICSIVVDDLESAVLAPFLARAGRVVPLRIQPLALTQHL